jgi:hypothetical protein
MYLLSVCQQTTNILFTILLLIYIIYGFDGFADNLLNRPIDGATISVRKSASEKALLFVRLSVPFSLT